MIANCRTASIAATLSLIVFACFDLDALQNGSGDDDGGALGDAIGPGFDGGGTGDANANGDVVTQNDSSTNDGGGTDTGPGIDAGPSWKLYSRSIFASTQWNNVPLDGVWTGANAPPPRGILATVKLGFADRLIVVTDQNVYMRDGVTWIAPKPLKDAMNLLVGRSFRGARHLYINPDGGGPTEYISFSDNPTAIIYETDGYAFNYFDQRTVSDSPGPISAPQGSKQSRWSITMIDVSKKGTVDYLNEYEMYEGDTTVYFYDATPAWTNKWPFASCPLFSGTTGTPPEPDIMSGWHDDKSGTTYLVVR